MYSQDLTTKIEQYANLYSPEKAYLHFDKHTYAPGETIWFKAYLLNELSPALGSKTFYVDWMDEKGNIIQHTVSPLINAVTAGQYELPSEYIGNSITVRAYTRWMLNFDTAFLFKKTIPIILKNSTGKPQKIEITPQLAFFPEGGDAIAGINNKIAFKATDQYGRPVTIKGIVSSTDGKFVDSLRTMHDGMGYFNINPKAGTAYKAKWTYEKSAEKTTLLPEIKTNGLSIQVGVTPGRRSFAINLTPSFEQQNDSLHIIGTMYQHIVFKISKPTNAPVAGIIPINNLPYGVLTITVFDKNMKPLAERITYINNNNNYTITPEFEVERWGLSYRARDEVRIKLPEAVVSSISVAVTDLAIGTDSSENILSNLMLTSELKGKVHNPAYYFSDTANKVQQQLDLVMLTNGWRKFNWEAIQNNQLPKINHPKDTTFLSLSGKVIGIMPTQVGPTSSVVVMMKQKDAEGKVIVSPIMKDGTFNDPNTIIFDTAKVYYQIQDKGMEGASIQFMPYKLRMPRVGKGWISPMVPDTTGLAYHLLRSDEANGYADKKKYKELEEVIVKARGKTPVQLLDEKYASGLFSGDGIQFDLLNDPTAQSALDIFTYLQGRVAGLQITGQGSNASLSWRGGAPQLYIDEMPATTDFVANLNVSDVAYIKAFRPPFMGGFNGANGAVAIYTRRGGDMQQESGKGLSGAKIEGYTVIKEFYSPKYYSMEVPPDADRDVRTTIYWNPNVSIDPAKKEIILSFYNNDVTDAFNVIIEGMTADGRLIHLTTTME
ncbi:MAG: hypothetical protein ACK5NK_10820 [Niabella sp.]